ncbi:MAG TPA: universal stress protein [Azospirillum sp.]|nr:universal stress protein [Azospirillum sp.]
MSMRHLLVHVDASERSVARLEFAVALAKRFQAKLTGLFAQKESFGPSLVARRASEHLLRAMEDTRAIFEEATRAAGVQGEWWQVEHGEHTNVVTQTVICARYADLAILGQHDPEASVVPEDMVEQVLLNSGRPVLVFPNIGRFGPPGRKVLIAWNGSREAARAVNDAVPLMQGAESVTVLAVHAGEAPPDAGKVPQVDIVAHLRTHGVEATYERLPLSEIAFADAVLNRCYETEADLLVMGGYGQYGFPLFYRGSNTRHILRTMTLPTLLSH